MAKSKSARKRARVRTRAGTSGSTRAASGSSTARGARAGSGGGRARATEDAPARYRETSGRDWRHSFAYIAIFAVSVIVAVTVVYPRRGPVLAALLVLISLWTLVGWHNRAFAYRCANCRRVFQVPTIVNFLTFQGVSRRPDGTYKGWKSLTCPYCHQRTKATVVRKKEAPVDRKKGAPGSDARLLR